MWFRIMILAVGTFALGTDVQVVAGILPTIAHDIAVPVATSGLLVTVFALTYALGDPTLATLTGSMARRRLLQQKNVDERLHWSSEVSRWRQCWECR